MTLEHIKVRDVVVFGWTSPLANCWWTMANTSISQGWKSIDMQKFVKSFQKNIEDCYESLAQFRYVDLDSEREYRIFFNNERKLWDIQIVGNEGIQVSGDDRKEVFKSAKFKVTSKKAADILKLRLQTLEEVVEPHLTDPEMVYLDTTKLEAIDSMLHDELLMKNLRLGKYLKAIE